MLELKKIDALEELKTLKNAYMMDTTAPLDGMWLCGFVHHAEHFGFYYKEALIGFCCINEDRFLLQFYLNPTYQDEGAGLFSSLFEEGILPGGKANGAFVSTAEPQFLSCCADQFRSFEVISLMYQLLSSIENRNRSNDEMSILGQNLRAIQLDEAVSFAHAAIAAPREWLTDYFGNLINRKELFGAWRDGQLIATGECRGYDSFQKPYADVGMIVSKQERGKGIATRVLKDLILVSKQRGLHPICSTEKGNLAAQKAITRSGFVARNRILKFPA